MDASGWAALIAAITASGAVPGLIYMIGRAWRASVNRAVLEQQAASTLEAKNQQIEELTVENRKLWELLESLTS